MVCIPTTLPLSCGGLCATQMVAGLLGPATNWRLPFLVMAAPTLALAVLLLLTVKEPPRGGECLLTRCTLDTLASL